MIERIKCGNVPVGTELEVEGVRGVVVPIDGENWWHPWPVWMTTKLKDTEDAYWRFVSADAAGLFVKTNGSEHKTGKITDYCDEQYWRVCTESEALARVTEKLALVPCRLCKQEPQRFGSGWSCGDLGCPNNGTHTDPDGSKWNLLNAREAHGGLVPLEVLRDAGYTVCSHAVMKPWWCHTSFKDIVMSDTPHDAASAHFLSNHPEWTPEPTMEEMFLLNWNVWQWDDQRVWSWAGEDCEYDGHDCDTPQAALSACRADFKKHHEWKAGQWVKKGGA